MMFIVGEAKYAVEVDISRVDQGYRLGISYNVRSAETSWLPR
jgi:hypothetical protein